MTVRWVPIRVREWLCLQQRRRRQWPRTGTVGFGPLHGVRPARRVFEEELDDEEPDYEVPIGVRAVKA